jgi:hypothetical protein
VGQLLHGKKRTVQVAEALVMAWHQCRSIGVGHSKGTTSAEQASGEWCESREEGAELIYRQGRRNLWLAFTHGGLTHH